MFIVKCSCSSKGALAGMKDPGPLQEAIACGDLSAAKSLLGTAEFGEHRFVFTNDCQLITCMHCLHTYSVLSVFGMCVCVCD